MTLDGRHAALFISTAIHEPSPNQPAKLRRIRFQIFSSQVPFIPENSGGVNCEKCGGRKRGGPLCPLSIIGLKFPLNVRKKKESDQRES